MKKIISYILVGIFGISILGGNVYGDSEGGECNGIKLNTNFPIVGNCIETSKGSGTTPINAFPKMMSALTKIIMSLVLIACFILIIVAGVMRAGDKPNEGKKLLEKVAITILLLGFSGAILRLINPNFFG